MRSNCRLRCQDLKEISNKIFLVKISDPEKKAKEPKKGDEPDLRLGLPRLVMAYKEAGRGGVTWDQLEGAASRWITMSWSRRSSKVTR
jgi:hypothetical protein